MLHFMPGIAAGALNISLNSCNNLKNRCYFNVKDEERGDHQY